jgi:cell volume regulation protein A
MSLLTQGTTIGLVARRQGVAMPDVGDEREQRAVFRDFELCPNLPVALVFEFYNLPPPAGAEQPLGEWMAAELRRPPLAGDSVAPSPATRVVHELAQGRISRVGLGLPD